MFFSRKRSRVELGPAVTGWVSALGSRSVSVHLGKDGEEVLEVLRKFVDRFYNRLSVAEPRPDHFLLRRGDTVHFILWYQRVSQDAILKHMLRELASERRWAFEDRSRVLTD